MHILPPDFDEVEANLVLQDVRPAFDFSEAVMAPPAAKKGKPLPWGKPEWFSLRDSELTVWAGENGSGKSLLLGQVMAWLLPTTRVLIASMEMRPEETIARMINQCYGGVAPAEYKRKWLEWTGRDLEARLMIYDQLDTVPSEKILAMVKYAASKLGCQHIVIDSLTKCGVPKNEGYDQQTSFVDRLAWAAKTHGAHVHLVCHLRKGDDRTKAPQKWDVRGASEITDLADNVILVWRNRNKEAAKEKDAAGGRLSEKESEALAECDTFVRVDKQRHHSWEGTMKFWWDRESGQFWTTKRLSYDALS